MKTPVTYPHQVKVGSSIVTIYRSKNQRGYTGFTLAYYLGTKRVMRAIADEQEAAKEANRIALELSGGNHAVLELRSGDVDVYRRAVNVLQPTGIGLTEAAQMTAEAFKILGGSGSVLDACREYARRNLHRLPDMTVAQAVKETLAIKERQGASNAWLKLLRHHLGKLARDFNCQIKSVRASDLSDWLTALPVSSRSKKNTLGCLRRLFIIT